MIIEGKILQVMETWPLQLVIETKKRDKIYVTLLENTNLVHKNQNVNLNELMPNVNVKINGEYKVNNSSMTANSIEIINRSQ